MTIEQPVERVMEMLLCQLQQDRSLKSVAKGAQGQDSMLINHTQVIGLAEIYIKVISDYCLNKKNVALVVDQENSSQEYIQASRNIQMTLATEVVEDDSNEEIEINSLEDSGEEEESGESEMEYEEEEDEKEVKEEAKVEEAQLQEGLESPKPTFGTQQSFGEEETPDQGRVSLDSISQDSADREEKISKKF